MLRITLKLAVVIALLSVVRAEGYGYENQNSYDDYGGGYEEEMYDGYGQSGGKHHGGMHDGYGYGGGYAPTKKPRSRTRLLLYIALPLAAIALLTLIPAFLNPLLFPLSVTNAVVGAGGRRRREAVSRGITDAKILSSIDDLDSLESFISSNPLAHSKANLKAVAEYISSGGLQQNSNKCMERMACESASVGSDFNQMERNFLQTLIKHVLKNPYVSKTLKSSLRKASSHSSSSLGHCEKYYCEKIDK